MESAVMWVVVALAGYLFGWLGYAAGKYIHKPKAQPVMDGDPNSEFICEVVRITSLTPVEGSDRLDQATFETRGSGPSAYQVVVGRGDFQVGDLAIYVGVDAMVPLTHPSFEFLGKRLDAKRHYPLYRLRAAKFLKRVFSQGLLIPNVRSPATDLFFEFGQQMAGHLGVTKYVSPEELTDVAPSDVRRSSSSAGPSPVYGLVSLKKEPNTFTYGEPVHVTEKVHGTNFRFGWVRRKLLGFNIGWRFFVGSHRVEKVDGNKGWYDIDVWNSYAKQNRLAERTAGHKGLVFYGELFGKTSTGSNIQDLTYGREDTDLVVFDVFRISSNEWLPFAERCTCLARLGLKAPPDMGTYAWEPQLAMAYAEGMSALDPETIREGVVVEALTGPRRKAKFVSQQYLLRA